MDIEFDFKGDPIGGVISNCEYNYRIDTGLDLLNGTSQAHCLLQKLPFFHKIFRFSCVVILMAAANSSGLLQTT